MHMKLKSTLAALFILFLTATLFAQKKELTYYLPDINYDKKIPTPEDFLGYQIGEWHISHDQQLAYMRQLAELSPRIVLTEYARTYENRPLIYLTITSEKNHRELEEIKATHNQLADPTTSNEVDISKQPIVIYQGYSVHGNEASGGNAAPLVAYYLAAGKGKEVEDLLDNAVILLDPCYNPDGFNRFSTWTNMHKHNAITADPADREYNEVWPGGRTNHYWFDLNRDWLPVVHPESQGRIGVFQDWHPNILTDHHEMSTNATFFFQPGITTRTHPLTPKQAIDLTEKIGNYHAIALESIGSLYFTQERYDDYYYGKGSTYPDVNGSIGILFEQASSRGKVQESDNGLLEFPFTIRNQVATSLSTQKAALGLKDELLEYRRSFYISAMNEATNYPRKAFIFGEAYDQPRLTHFLELLRRHQVDVYRLKSPLTIAGKDFETSNSYIVPLEQPKFKLIRAMFERNLTFEDSLFYDVSAWTLPMAFNLDYAALDQSQYDPVLLGDPVNGIPAVTTGTPPDYSAYAYLFEWDSYYAPRALYYMMKNGLRAKVSTKEFVANGKRYGRGTIMVPVVGQSKNPDDIFQMMQLAARATGTNIYDVDGGLTPEGPDLGSSYLRPLRLPEVLIMAGDGVTSYDAGEQWFILDRRYEIPATLREPLDISRTDLSRYNVIIMPDGNYNTLNGRVADQLREWVQQGGTLVGMKRAINWLQRNNIGTVSLRKAEPKEDQLGRRPYGLLDADEGSQEIGGSIFKTLLDLSHPLGYGYRKSELPVLRKGNVFLEVAKNPYATPLVYAEDPLLSGYISDENAALINSSASIVVSGSGSGRIIYMADNPNFRAFFYGTSKLFANAIFFGHIIDGSAIER
jgi:hypothetical protein